MSFYLSFFQPAVCDAVSSDNHVFGLSMCCRMLQQKLRALAVMCSPNEIRQDGHYHYHALLPTLPSLAMLIQAGNNRGTNSHLSRLCIKVVTTVCVQIFFFFLDAVYRPRVEINGVSLLSFCCIVLQQLLWCWCHVFSL